MAAIEDEVRAWAEGVYSLVAGVELLIRTGKAIREGAPWLVPAGSGRVGVDVDVLVEHSGAWSGAERRIVAIAASLLSAEHEVNLQDALSNLDRKHAALVLAAVAHATGSHEHSDLVFNKHGLPIGARRPGSLYPWPDETDE